MQRGLGRFLWKQGVEKEFWKRNSSWNVFCLFSFTLPAIQHSLAMCCCITSTAINFFSTINTKKYIKLMWSSWPFALIHCKTQLLIFPFFPWFPCSWYLSSDWQPEWHATGTADKSNVAVEAPTKYGYVPSQMFAMALQNLQWALSGLLTPTAC